MLKSEDSRLAQARDKMALARPPFVVDMMASFSDGRSASCAKPLSTRCKGGSSIVSPFLLLKKSFPLRILTFTLFIDTLISKRLMGLLGVIELSKVMHTNLAFRQVFLFPFCSVDRVACHT
jgi:hypothetical protein